MVLTKFEVIAYMYMLKDNVIQSLVNIKYLQRRIKYQLRKSSILKIYKAL